MVMITVLQMKVCDCNIEGHLKLELVFALLCLVLYYPISRDFFFALLKSDLFWLHNYVLVCKPESSMMKLVLYNFWISPSTKLNYHQAQLRSYCSWVQG